MPIYTVQAPDGKTYQIEGPAGATAEQLGAVISGQQAQPKEKPGLSAQDRIDYDPTNGMSTLDRVRAGFGKAVYDVARGIGQFTPLVSRDDVAESRKRDAALMNTGAGMTGNLLGNVAIAAPTAAIPGVNTIAGSAALGAGMGLLQPSTSTEETLKNVGIGGVAGAAVPTAITAYKTGKSLLEPFYESGRKQIAGRVLNAAAGDQAPQVIANLQNAQPIVQGSLPTVGQAAGVPSIAALERTATAVDPVVANQMAARLAQQNQARIAALQGITPDKAAAVAARDATANALYGAANPQAVNMTGQLAALMQRPSMQAAVQRAEKLALEKGETLDLANLSGKTAHYIKMAMDDIASGAPATGVVGNELRATRDTLGAFLKELEQQIPEYGAARQAYAQMSRPVNQADLLTEIANRATNKVTGNLTPSAYANAATDKVAQSVVGKNLSQVLDQRQQALVDAILKDLQRANFAQTAGRGVGSDTVQKMAYSNLLDQAGVPQFLRNFGPAGIVGNVAQRAGQIAYKDANQKMATELAEAMLDPQKAAALMQAGRLSPQAQALIQGLRRAGAAGGAAVPALVNANQE